MQYNDILYSLPDVVATKLNISGVTFMVIALYFTSICLIVATHCVSRGLIKKRLMQGIKINLNINQSIHPLEFRKGFKGAAAFAFT